MKKIVMIAAAVLACGAAQAQTNASPIYGEIGYSMLHADVSFYGLDIGAVRGILGYEVHPNLALEAMLAVGVTDDRTQGVFVENIKLKLEHGYGLYIKPKFQVTDRLQLFGRVGYAESKFKLTWEGASASDSDHDVSYGVGMAYGFSKSLYGTLDYMRYYGKDDLRVNGITFGLGYKF